MNFRELAEKFDALERTTSRLTMTKELADLFKQATPTEAESIAYLCLGSLNPTYIGTQFNFAEKSLIKVIAILINKSPQTIKEHAHRLGDLGMVMESEHKFRATKLQTVQGVVKELHHFINMTGTGSQEMKEQKLLQLLQSQDAHSAKYIVRIIEGKLRLGFSEMTLLDAFSWMMKGDKSLRSKIEDAYNITADIGLIVRTLKEQGLPGLQHISIVPGIPIRPALAERMTDATAIMKKLGHCVAQPKLDGFRLQVHVDHTQKPALIRFFSRNLLDMSHMFPDLTHALKALKVKTLVAEGEAIGVDVETGSFLPFQETVKRKRKHGIAQMAQDFPLKLFLFDLLYLNGKSLLDKSHHERRQMLLKVIPANAIITPVAEQSITSANELDTVFADSISRGLEGLVVKRIDAHYKPGKRNFNWIKLKRHEEGSLEDTVDCVVLGYNYGLGKRAAFGIGALLVGVFNDKKDRFETIAKIGTGLSDDEWRAQKKACDRIKVAKQPHDVMCAPELFPDVWVQPQIVCLVRADEITRSPLHKAGATEAKLGYALRFPRLMGYRPEKSPYEATTVAEITRLYDLQFQQKLPKIKKKHTRKNHDSD
jgi:DNA ligase-1